MAGSTVRRLVVGAIVMTTTTTLSAQTVAVRPETERPAATTSVTVNVDHGSLEHVLTQIAREAGLTPFYSTVITNSTKNVSLHVKNVLVADAFEQALRGTGLKALIGTRRVVFTLDDDATATVQGVITGQVIDGTSKRPLSGATVLLDDGKIGVLADKNGTFRLSNVSAGTHTVRVRMLGYVKVTKSVTVTDGDIASVNVALEPSANALQQVVVTGSVIATERKTIPNAITVITAKELEQRGITHIDQLFRGDVPGLWVQNKGSAGVQPGQVTMASRGSTSLDGALKKPIKTYVDGVELADPSYLGLIDPRSIERIEILTGPQASTIYGSGAINGVMQIFTKRGTSSAPQLELSLQSGLIQNNFSSAMTPQHDYAARVSGSQAGISFNTGGSWTYLGPWSPMIHMATLSGYGGLHVQRQPFTFDLNVRRVQGTNRDGGGTNGEYFNQGVTTGLYKPNPYEPAISPQQYRSTGQTLGAEVTATPFAWWSHRFTAGVDGTESSNFWNRPQYGYQGDTLLYFLQTTSSKTSLAYSTTAQIPLSHMASATITGGVDGWHSLDTHLDATPSTTTGTIQADRFGVFRTPTHNNGAFVQGQLGILDVLFITYGLRAEWNPYYGRNANPNRQPRMGIAYTQAMGPITAKLRGSFGHATLPPGAGQTVAHNMASYHYPSNYLAAFDNADVLLANPELLPTQQQGSEGGLEVYVGNTVSTAITIFNQTVDNQIFFARVDSARSLLPAAAYGGTLNVPTGVDGYAYYPQYRYVNIGSIRNDGIEWQGSVTVGAFTTKGTYSITKSRIIGITPKYRAAFPQYVPGSAFSSLPEHTYAIAVQYAHGKTSATLNVQGQGGQIAQSNWDCGFSNAGCINHEFMLIRSARLDADKPAMDTPRIPFVTPGYALADFNVQRQFNSRVEGMLQLQNVANSYPRTDAGADLGSIGRQTKIGARIRY